MRALGVVNTLRHVPWAVLSALCAYALRRGGKCVAVILFLLFAVQGANHALYLGFGLKGVRRGGPDIPSGYGRGCEEAFPDAFGSDPAVIEWFVDLSYNSTSKIIRSQRVDAGTQVFYASRACGIAGNIFLLSIIWVTLRQQFKLNGVRVRSFTNLFLYDGTACLIALVTLDVLGLAFSFVSPRIHQTGRDTAVSNSLAAFGRLMHATEITTPLISILISRFLIQLQAASQAQSESSDLHLDVPPLLCERLPIGSLHTLITSGEST
ncbi:hypothetical protein C8Q80DRAFT_409095 [Daedaleopsis nitida]|nr:hypothetical protein C8Q80DRAFT_409095 [Daedaleopsis nitida]